MHIHIYVYIYFKVITKKRLVWFEEVVCFLFFHFGFTGSFCCGTRAFSLCCRTSSHGAQASPIVERDSRTHGLSSSGMWARVVVQ